MTVLDVEVTETCLFYEYVQGNSFNGLEYFNDVEETFDLAHSVYHVFNDVLSESMEFSEAFDPFHLLVVDDGFEFEEQFGLPVQVSATSLEVMHEQVVRPVDIAFFGMEVLHGVDIFWEEVSSGWHGTNYAQGVPYYWFDCREWLNFDIEALVVKVNFATSLDRLNMRHTVEQIYDFNNIILDRFFTYDWPSLGWGKQVNDNLAFIDNALRYLGFHIHEHLFPETELTSKWVGAKYLSDTIFSYDNAKQIKGYSNSIQENLDILGLLQAPYFDKLLSGFGAVDDLELSNMTTNMNLFDAIKAISSVAIEVKISKEILENMAFVDEFLLSAMVRNYLESINESLSLSVGTIANTIIIRAINDALVHTDSESTKLLVDDTITDHANIEGGVN